MMAINWIAWIAPSEPSTQDPALVSLREQGWKVRHCPPGQLQQALSSTQTPASMRILQTRHFASLDALRAEYSASDLPALIITDTAEQEADLLEQIRSSDEVVRGLYPSRLLLGRIRRMLKQPTPALAHGAEIGSEELVASFNAAGLDPLTGCLQRGEWAEQLVHHLRERQAQDCSAVLLLDIDDFKRINDQHGHAIGDAVLAHLGQALRNELAPSDRLGRFDGDGFTVLMQRYDRDSVLADARRLLAHIAAMAIPLPSLRPKPASASGLFKRLMGQEPGDEVDAARIELRSSGGLCFIEEGADFNQLLTQADQAVQAAKNLGRNRLEVAAAASEAALQAPHSPLEGLAAARPAAASRLGHDHDPLTQLPHRRYFDARLAREFSTARKHGRALSLALIDIQQMHLLNRRYGFAAGDRILQGVAEATRRSVRLVDWVARIGGNQFAVVMPDTDISGAAPVLARLQGKLQQAPLSGLDGAPLPVSTRLVLRQMDAETLSAEQWLLETLAALRAGDASTPA
ncbi:diguanylate cyclase domain-containing protein [Paucibacter sp. KCTC 42545]|uniref:diguanylate cyclase domain-containing protein n=1 Tax=Paucibacter sp. KCTC 42545 TaxID=1768242 RepID=UPI000733AD0B|nr:GGDEF domain-containing protein [Paucibacter sp. KCTC 42545]ALT75945.1 hypothetical protein AT984_00650 [Paucibacter sp. KCTC 42545]